MIQHRDTVLWRLFQQIAAGVRITPNEFIEELNEAGWHLVSNLEVEKLDQPITPHLTSTFGGMNEYSYKLTVDDQILDFRALATPEFDKDRGATDYREREYNLKILRELGGALGIKC